MTGGGPNSVITTLRVVAMTDSPCACPAGAPGMNPPDAVINRGPHSRFETPGLQSMDRLSGMEAFAKAVETGSFSSAGATLGLSPQAVGKQVRLLEEHLGVRLIHRTTRRQSLTEAGRELYERVRIILAEVEAVEAVAAHSQAVPGAGSA